MTTPVDWVLRIPDIRDAAAVEIVERIVDAQAAVVEAQLAQVKELKQALSQQRARLSR